MQPSDPSVPVLVDLVSRRAWVPLAIVVIHALVRLLKSPKLPAPFNRIPPNYRPWVAFVLGIVSGILQSVVTGTALADAIIGGLISAAFAAFGHDLFIEGVRGGQEIGGRKEPSSNASPSSIKG